MSRWLQAILMSGLLLLSVSPAQAESTEKSPLTSKMEAFNVTYDKEKKKEILTPTEEAEPGQVIHYRMTYANVGKGPLRNLIINGPIPKHTSYLAKSANTKIRHDFRVSIDGGQTWDKEPVKRVRVGPDGKPKEVIIPPKEYTHTRWIVRQPLYPEREMLFNYRVTVD